ncbi:hypothetical protein Plhal304r1_c014g0052211 [Plasmopara halstedii]
MMPSGYSLALSPDQFVQCCFSPYARLLLDAYDQKLGTICAALVKLLIELY